MACSSKLDDLLMCPICLERFVEPKTLACLHTFCCGCLESCRRPYRRDIICPVCKRITTLSNLGVQGLQSDFRIEQLRDILDNQMSVPSSPSPPSSPGGEERGLGEASQGRRCDVCVSESLDSTGQWHCPQCMMYYCETCLTQRHNTNSLFASHLPVDMDAAGVDAPLLCGTHAGQIVRFVCRPCAAALCTLCVLQHDSSHHPDALEENGSIGRHRRCLRRQLACVTTRLAEVHKCSKYLETVRDSQQGALREASSGISARADALVGAVRAREAELLADAKQQVDSWLTEAGLDGLTDIRFQVTNIETLCADLEAAADGSPLQCLIAYKSLMARVRSTVETALPLLTFLRAGSRIRFVPATEGSIVGTLREYNIKEQATASSSGGFFSNERVDSLPEQSASGVTTRRLSSILGALSPTRREVRLSRVKTSSAGRPQRAQTSRSPNSTINVDELMRAESSRPPATRLFTHKLLFCLNQRITRLAFPSSATLLPDGQVVVAEADSRLHLFDGFGNSVRLLAWGQIQAAGVAWNSTAEVLAVTDQKDHCVKLYTMSDTCVSSWGKFGTPSGIAVTAIGSYVVTDVGRHSISLHSAVGEQMRAVGEWGSGDTQFKDPTNVAIDHTTGCLVISDSGNHCIKVFSADGVFIRKFPFLTRDDQFARRPHGVAVDSRGNIAVVDKTTNRICLFSVDGLYMNDLLTQENGVRHPVDIYIPLKLDGQPERCVVVEAYEGFFANGMHHAVKVFSI